MAKATKDYKREHGLTVEQYNAIDLLITGKSDQETADIIGVNRVTVTKWRNYDLHFRADG
ncbi:helix-turn-helix domain-containing protein [Bacillus sp. ISL-75]|uniref:helix-turn-helix domain-containing protein n=1 Tax=Bacillus sp. ISL-75 TaxID=2819137 RepID=UPI001BEC508C|nr:helix-turn-helix domain-containing protein [Bacillus sp. ISL-75]MBT2729196.1 helix-turn-helix domain-containing protein [Bacillus sp. ISL-75]